MPFLVEDEITNLYIHVQQKGMPWRAGNWGSLESHVGVFLDSLVCGFLFLFPFGKRLSRFNEDGRGEVLASPPERWQPQGLEYQGSEVAYTTDSTRGVCVWGVSFREYWSGGWGTESPNPEGVSICMIYELTSHPWEILRLQAGFHPSVGTHDSSP